MQVTRAADYAVRVMVHLATLPFGQRSTRDELAASGEVPGHFLSKILQTLSRSGLITSHRGASGGFSLAKPAESVTLLDVVEAVDGPIQLNVCVVSGPGCNRQTWCAVHEVWAEAQNALTSVLRGATLARLASEGQKRPAFCGVDTWS